MQLWQLLGLISAFYAVVCVRLFVILVTIMIRERGEVAQIKWAGNQEPRRHMAIIFE